MKHYIKKFLFVAGLLIVSMFLLDFIYTALYNSDELYGWPLWLFLVLIIGVIYTTLFVLIDLIKPNSFRYTLIFNLILTAYIIIFFIIDAINSGLSGAISYENIIFFYSPTIFLFVHLIIVLYRRFSVSK